MLVLGIESTCDETSAALVENGKTILSHVIASQVSFHQPFGGVVPELASRHHIDDCLPTIDQVMKSANKTLSDIDVIAVAEGPGLIGSLLVGIHTAKTLAWSLKKPLVGVNHIEAHLYAAMMSPNCPDDISSLFPALGVVLSGGHTSLIIINDIGSYRLIGQTVDDALGEAFDKVAKMMGLPYPGGPAIEKLALTGDPDAYSLKAGQVKMKPYHFSFSGLKTGALYAILEEKKKRGDLPEDILSNIAASFQKTAFTDLINKIEKAVIEWKPKALFLGGGVTNNKTLRQSLSQKVSLPLFWPEPTLCLDNAAMIAGLGYHVYKRERKDETYDLQPRTRIPFHEPSGG